MKISSKDYLELVELTLIAVSLSPCKVLEGRSARSVTVSLMKSLIYSIGKIVRRNVHRKETPCFYR